MVIVSWTTKGQRLMLIFAFAGLTVDIFPLKVLALVLMT